MTALQLAPVSHAKGINFVHLNCRSMHPKFKELKHTFNEFEIITFSESWLTDMHDAALLSWPHKNFHRIDRPDRAGGGLITYLSNRLFSHSSRMN